MAIIESSAGPPRRNATALADRPTSPAGDVWSILRTLFGQQKRRFLIAASALDLHPAQASALMSMASEDPVPMNELAHLLGCDNSNVTGLVDRLEARGLVARQPYDRDRRVKHIVLTPKGAKLRGKLAARLGGPPDGLTRLSLSEQRQLRDLLRRVLDGD